MINPGTGDLETKIRSSPLTEMIFPGALSLDGPTLLQENLLMNSTILWRELCQELLHKNNYLGSDYILRTSLAWETGERH